MKLYPTMPDAETIRRDVLSTTMRPTGGLMPGVIRSGVLVLNVYGHLRHVDAAAVYLVEGWHHPPKAPRLARLVVVTGARRPVQGGRATVEWCEGVIGEVEHVEDAALGHVEADPLRA